MQSEPQSPPIAMITGVTGQDGCYLAAHLMKHGYKIVGTTRQISTNRLWGLKQLGICNKIILESLCLDSVEQIEKLIDDYTPTMIFHLAGQSSPHLSFSLPKETFESIAGSTRRLLEAMPVSYTHLTLPTKRIV